MNPAVYAASPVLDGTGEERSLSLPRWWLLLLLFGCVVQFTSAWLYGERVTDVAAAARGEFTAKSGSVPFQYLLWLNLVVLMGVHWRRQGLSVLWALKPFWPYGLVCVFAGLVGFNPVGAARPTVFWLVALMSAALLAWHLPGRTLARAIVGALAILMAGSIVVALGLPSRGTHLYFTQTVWAGLFVLKNQLGWIAALTLVASVTLWPLCGARLAIAGIVTAVACLVFSKSMGALLAAGAALGYLAVAVWLRRRVRPALAVLLIAAGSAVLLLLMALAAQPLAEAMGRDLTLTGRTLIWSAYWQEISKSLWTGHGIGAFTGTSPFTLPIAFRFRDYGLITTPHSLYLAVLGDAGLPGLLALLMLFGYFGVIVPLRQQGPYVNALAAMVVFTALQGLSETHDAYGAGPTWFLISMFWMASTRWTPSADGTDAAPR